MNQRSTELHVKSRSNLFVCCFFTAARLLLESRVKVRKSSATEISTSVMGGRSLAVGTASHDFPSGFVRSEATTSKELKETSVTMKLFVLLFLLRISSVDSVIHSLKYFFTTSCGGSNIPEFVVDGFVDGVQITHYDSNTRRLEPKQDWMNKITEDDPKYWDICTEESKYQEFINKRNIEDVKQCFNQTGGFHVYQKISGCKWDDETDEVKGFEKYGYDGEDYIVLDLKTETWVASTPQAVITKHKCDNNKYLMEKKKHDLTRECPHWLKMFLSDKSSVMRKERPLAALLQKTPSSPVTCHATGFYPDRADLFWRRDEEEELHEGVVRGEILPNHDGTFQMSVDLDISLIKAEDWRRYSCVFHQDGGQEVILTPLDKSVIMTNWRSGTPTDAVAVGVGVGVGVVVLLLLMLSIIGLFFLWSRNCDGNSPSITSKGWSSSGDEDVNKSTTEETNMLR